MIKMMHSKTEIRLPFSASWTPGLEKMSYEDDDEDEDEDELRRQTWILETVVSRGEKKSFRPLGSFQNVQGIVPHSHHSTTSSLLTTPLPTREVTVPRLWIRTGVDLIWDSSFFGNSNWQMEWAAPVDHWLDYGEFLQERPRAYEENEDGLLQGLMVCQAIWLHSFWSVFGTGATPPGKLSGKYNACSGTYSNSFLN